MKYEVLIEHDEETGSYTGSVLGLPIVVDADSEGQALQMLRDGIRFHLETEGAPPPHLHGKVFTVDVEA